MTNLNKDDIEQYHTDCFKNITTSVVQTLCKECSKHFLICLTSFVTQGPINIFQILFHISHNYVTKWAELFKQNIFHIFLCKSDSLSYHYVLTFGLKNLNIQYIKIH